MSVLYHPEKHIHANGIELCVDSFGDQEHPPILLIMGLATQLIHWDDEFCKSLAEKGFWVIRFDNRDIGKSTKFKHHKAPGLTAFLAHQWFGRKLRSPYYLNDMAKDTFGLMDALSIERAHIVGVSMGGMIAQTMAIVDPERIISLTSIMSTTGARSLPKAKASVSFKMLRPVPKDEEGYVQQALEMWQLLHGPHYPFDAQRIENLLRRARQRSFYPKGILRQLSAIIASGDRTPRLAEVKVPTLVMHGDSDPLVPYACGEATAAAIPAARFKTLKGMGHTLPKQLWEQMIDEITHLAKAAQ